MISQFKELLNPSTVLGAFLISMIAGIAVSFILGFFTGKRYHENKKNRIKLKYNSGSVAQDVKIYGGKNAE